MLSSTEDIARQLYRYYCPFLLVRYNDRSQPWLRNPATGHALELDLYFPQVRVAVEVQGVQHGRPIAGMHRSDQDFRDGQGRDRDKLELCLAHNVHLFTLTVFQFTHSAFTPHIRLFLDTCYQRTTDHRLAHEIKRTRLQLATMPAPTALYQRARGLGTFRLPSQG